MDPTLLFLVVWGAGLAFSPLAYGISLAYWQRKFPGIAAAHYEADVHHAIGDAAFCVVVPPVGIFCVLTFYAFGIPYGLQFRRTA